MPEQPEGCTPTRSNISAFIPQSSSFQKRLAQQQRQCTLAILDLPAVRHRQRLTHRHEMHLDDLARLSMRRTVEPNAARQEHVTSLRGNAHRRIEPAHVLE